VTMPSTEITDWTAGELSQAIHARQVSCREVMQAYLARIHRLNPVFNAVVNLAPDEVLLAQSDAFDQELQQGESRGWMHGMPQAIKDTGDAVGFPTTLGCTLLKDRRPVRDSVAVARMRAAGCIVIGKTNMPEFGLGSHTYNRLFGRTPNAWDPHVSAGGSSGGAAVALAQRLLPVADGSDFMGSLRNPAGWNHVYGMRPSQGRVPTGPGPDVWVGQLGTDGPMARNVADLHRLLVTQAGHDPRLPLSIDAPLDARPPAADPDALRGLRVGWLGDLGGHLAMEPGILGVCEQALARMTQAGAHVEARPLGFDAKRLWDCWLAWRSGLIGARVGALLGLPGARDQIKPEALWEVAQGQERSVTDFVRASECRTAFYQHLLSVFEQVDVLALPVAQTWPFALEMDWPSQIGTTPMDTYHRWMEVTIYATLAGLPAISVPAGFDPSGRWPMGLQLIGRPRGDDALLRIAAAYEATLGELARLRPREPSDSALLG
jgi:amidase